MLNARSRDCECLDLRGNHFIYMQHNGGCRTTFESGAAYICVARYNENVNFRMKLSYAFHSFYFHLTPYTLQLSCVLFRYRSFAFVYYGADRVNLTELRKPRLLTRIDLLHSYRTGPKSHSLDLICCSAKFYVIIIIIINVICIVQIHTGPANAPY